MLLESALFRITPFEWLFVAVAAGGVVAFDLLNSAGERLSSKVSSGFDEDVRVPEDTSAAAVLVAAAAAAVIDAQILLLTRMMAFLGHNPSFDVPAGSCGDRIAGLWQRHVSRPGPCPSSGP